MWQARFPMDMVSLRIDFPQTFVAGEIFCKDHPRKVFTRGGGWRLLRLRGFGSHTYTYFRTKHKLYRHLRSQNRDHLLWMLSLVVRGPPSKQKDSCGSWNSSLTLRTWIIAQWKKQKRFHRRRFFVDFSDAVFAKKHGAHAYLIAGVGNRPRYQKRSVQVIFSCDSDRLPVSFSMAS